MNRRCPHRDEVMRILKYEVGAQLAELKALMDSGEKGFCQIVAVKEYGLTVREMVDVLAFWLWGTAKMVVRRFGE
jgi:hypothetical protein